MSHDNPPLDPAIAYQMLHDYFYRVARWPEDTDINAINAGFYAIRVAIEQNEILKRDLTESNRALESEQKARSEDLAKIESLQQTIEQLRRGEM